MAPNGWWDRKKWGPDGERRVTEGEMAKAIRLARDEEREFQMERRKGTGVESPVRWLDGMPQTDYQVLPVAVESAYGDVE